MRDDGHHDATLDETLDASALGPARPSLAHADASREPVTGRPGQRSVAAPPIAREADAHAPTEAGSSGDTAGTPHEAHDDDAPLDRSGRYHAGALLGEGGMGRVRLVEDLHIGRKVAVKTLHDEVATPAGIARFLREARVQGQLEHPSIVPVYDLGHDEAGRPYFTMRRLQGTTLRDVLARERKASEAGEAREGWSRRKLLSAFLSACMAVHYAHTRGVIHRDLKPTNIMLGEFGEVYVLDWGVARVQGLAEPAPEGAEGLSVERVSQDLVDSGAHATATGTLLGTPSYMSPEQLRGEHATLDARSDVYSLGLILYELCTLRPFHEGKGFTAIASETLLGVTAVPSAVVPDVAPELDAFVQRCTARDPAERFPTVGALARAVERYLDGDRDLQRRKALASDHAARALAAADRARDAVGHAQESLRKDAMRAVVQALALDPTQPDARKTFLRLLVEAPAEPPPAVREDMAAYAAQTRREGLRFGIFGLLTWCAAIPTALALGVRNLPAALAAASTVVALTLAMTWMYRAPVQRPRHAVVVAVMVTLAIMSLSSWLGPFVLVPAATSAVLTMMAAFCDATERRALLLLAVLIALGPFALEAAGVVPPSTLFDEGRVVLLARVFELHPRRTLAALLYVSVSFTLVPQVLVGRIRDEMIAVQQRFVTQAWHLRQIVDDADDATR